MCLIFSSSASDPIHQTVPLLARFAVVVHLGQFYHHILPDTYRFRGSCFSIVAVQSILCVDNNRKSQKCV